MVFLLRIDLIPLTTYLGSYLKYFLGIATNCKNMSTRLYGYIAARKQIHHVVVIARLNSITAEIWDDKSWMNVN